MAAVSGITVGVLYETGVLGGGAESSPPPPPALPVYSTAFLEDRARCPFVDLYVAYADSDHSYVTNLQYNPSAAGTDTHNFVFKSSRVEDCTQQSAAFAQAGPFGNQIYYSAADGVLTYTNDVFTATFSSTDVHIVDHLYGVDRTITPFGFQAEFPIPGEGGTSDGNYTHVLGRTDSGGWGVIEHACATDRWGLLPVYTDHYYDDWLMYVAEDRYGFVVRGDKLNYAYSGTDGASAHEVAPPDVASRADAPCEVGAGTVALGDMQSFSPAECTLGTMAWLTSPQAWWEVRNHTMCHV